MSYLKIIKEYRWAILTEKPDDEIENFTTYVQRTATRIIYLHSTIGIFAEQKGKTNFI